MKSTSLVYSMLAAVCLVGVVPVTPALAGTFADTYISASGADANSCVMTAPCQSVERAEDQTAAGGVIHCLDNQHFGPPTIFQSITIDCSNTTASIDGLTIQAPSTGIVRLVGLEIRTTSTAFQLGGTLYIEKCKILGATGGAGLVFEPQLAASLHISDSYIDGAGAGILLQPNPGGSVTATFDRVTITNNTGGGIKAVTTNGPVTVDITDSVVSNNGGNGLNAVSGAAGSLAILNISRSVIASNGGAGVQANGVSAIVTIDTTLLDSNVGGATAIVASGHIATYGTNRVFGTLGSGFNSSPPLQ